MRQRLVAYVALAALLGGALAVPAARAQMDSRDAIALQNQILELRHQMQVLQDQVARGGGSGGGGGGGGGGFLGLGGGGQAPAAGAGNDLVPQLLSRVQALEEEVRRLRGQMDDLQNASQRQYEDLNKQIGDLRFRVGQSAGGASLAAPAPVPAPAPSGLGAGAAAGGYAAPPPPAYAPPGYPPPGYAPPSYAPAYAPPPTLSPGPSTLGTVPAAPPPTAAAPAAPGTAPRTPETAIQQGYAALARRDYPGAEAAAREVLQNSRTSPRAYDAQFLLARALEGKRDYAQAAIAFDDTYNRTHTGAHAEEALLGLAGSLSAIGEKRAACETLAKLSHEFPNAHADEVRSARARFACS
jgi:TolA-binding protein